MLTLRLTQFTEAENKYRVEVALGKRLVETEVTVLALNACRSAHADAPTFPLPAEKGAGG